MTREIDKQVWLNDYATRSFRDLADQDYIAARMSYRAQLDEPFLWSAHQAIEKYLKAILLYNTEKATDLGHDLVKSLNCVKSIPDLQFQIPDDAEEFIDYLNDYGTNRYFSSHSLVKAEALLNLDRAVWFIRIYCQYLGGETVDLSGNKVRLFPLRLAEINRAQYAKSPTRFRITGGYLEKQIDTNSHSASFLKWKNFYYGKRKRKTIKNYTSRVSSSTPTHLYHPESYDILKQYVYFPKEIEKLVKQKKEASCSKTSIKR